VIRPQEIEKLICGVYRIHWISGGYSVAAVGRTHGGRTWLAPANWSSEYPSGVPSVEAWNQVEKVELIESAYPEQRGGGS
jgi:hypothetical protein